MYSLNLLLPDSSGPVNSLLARLADTDLNLSSHQETKLRGDVANIGAKLKNDLERALRVVLTTDQLKRCQEIKIQLQGLQALDDAQIQSELEVTSDQHAQICQIMRQGIEEARVLRRSLIHVREQTLERAMAPLEDRQKSIWEEIRRGYFEIGEEMTEAALADVISGQQGPAGEQVGVSLGSSQRGRLRRQVALRGTAFRSRRAQRLMDQTETTFERANFRSDPPAQVAQLSKFQASSPLRYWKAAFSFQTVPLRMLLARNLFAARFGLRRLLMKKLDRFL